MPSVSVIIPNYNHAIYLEQRIASILNQSFQDFELIILDDCSTDNSKEIIERYRSHPKVSNIIYNEKNSGSTFVQWEKGIKIAKGEYIWLAESDDYASVELLDQAMRIFSKYQNVGLVNCGSSWVDSQNQLIRQDDESTESEIIPGAKFIANQMTTGNYIYNASAVIFKRKYINLPLDETIKRMTYCGDWLFWVSLIATTSVYLLHKNLNNFRRHENTVSNRANLNGLFFSEGLIVYYKIKKILPKDYKSILSVKMLQWLNNFSQAQFPRSTKLKIFVKVTMKYPMFVLPFSFYKFKNYFN